MTNIAIIGAGLSALAVADSLKHRADITVFEKSRGVGGRMSTRHAEPYFFDHGAQFFRARTDAFRAFIAPMLEAGVIERWNARFIEIENRQITHRWQWGEQSAHYVCVPGMNAMAKYLSRGLPVQLATRVQSITKQHGKWSLQDDQDNELGDYDWVISTVPAAQACDLLPPSLPVYAKAKTAAMEGCFSLMLGFEKALPLEFDAALVRDEDISWISVNSSKPGRNDPFCLLVHSTNHWADQHIEDDPGQVSDYLCQQISAIIGRDVSTADYKTLHRWRYANIAKQSGDTHFIDTAENIGVCGDWFIQGRVEAAFTSGYELAKKIDRALNQRQQDD